MPEYPASDQMLRELYDREQIRQLKYKNMRHLDLKEWDEMAETFAEDATTSWVNGDVSLSGRDAIMEFLKSTPFAEGDTMTTVHQCAAMEITFTGPDTAKATSRLYNPMYHKGGDSMNLLLSFYHDEFGKRDGEWKITHSGHEYILEEAWVLKEVPSDQIVYRHPFG